MTDRRIRGILEQLEQVREDLLALSDDIWSSIDHNDSANHLRDQIKALLNYFGIDQAALSIYLRQDRDADA